MSVLDPSVISRIDVRRTAVDAVTDPLRTAILSGRIRPGQTLRQGEIAQEFGVSRTPVRQALRILHREGLVDLEPHRMAGVSDPSADAVEESFVIRAVLGAEAAKRAVPRLTDQAVDELRALHERMSSIDRTSDEWVALNQSFHETVHGACGWPHLIELIRVERRRVMRYLRISLRLSGRDAHEERAQILRACERREADLVPILVAKYIMRIAESVIEYINQQTSALGLSTPQA